MGLTPGPNFVFEVRIYIAMEFFLSRQKISPNVLINKDQVQKLTDSSGHCWRTSLNYLYNAMHNSQNYSFLSL